MLIPADVNKAYQAFFTRIVKSNTKPAVLNAIYQEKLDRLNQYMDVLSQLAEAGMEEQLSSLLSTLLEEWAIKEAVELLLHYPGVVFDPTSVQLQQSFWDKLNRQHQILSSELFLKLKQASDARAQAKVEQSQSWQSVAYRSIEDQRQQNQQFQNAAFQWVQGQQQMNQQWLQSQQQMWSQQQQANQQWANVAMVGAQQAQLGLKQWYDFAAATQENVTKVLAGTEQRQAVMVEQAIQKANTKKWMGRLMIVAVILGSFLALYGWAYYSMMHLLH